LRSSAEDRVFVPPLPVSLNELKQRITTAVASVDEDRLRSVWTELDYRIDICLATIGSHIEHLQLKKNVLQNHVSILAKSLIISFQYNIESVYFFYSNPVYAIVGHVCELCTVTLRTLNILTENN
jgi:hypothetical protein